MRHRRRNHLSFKQNRRLLLWCRRFLSNLPCRCHGKPYHNPDSTSTSGILQNSIHAVCQCTVLWWIKPYLITGASPSPAISDMSDCKMADLFTSLLLASRDLWIFFWVKYPVNFVCVNSTQTFKLSASTTGIQGIHCRKHNSDHLTKR